MDDRIEQTDGIPAVASSALGRRDMLKRTGFVVGAAALWNTPFVKTVGMSAAAESVVILDACPVTGQTGQPSDLTWKVVPRNADQQSNTATNPDDWTQTDNPAQITGDLGCLKAPWSVTVEVFVNSKTISGTPLEFKDITNLSPQFVVPGKPGAFTSFRITVNSGVALTCDSVQVIEGIHTSCSQPLEVDFYWGSIELVTVGSAGSAKG